MRLLNFGSTLLSRITVSVHYMKSEEEEKLGNGKGRKCKEKGGENERNTVSVLSSFLFRPLIF